MRTAVSEEELMKMFEVMEVDEAEVMQMLGAKEVNEAEVMQMFGLTEVDDAELMQMFGGMHVDEAELMQMFGAMQMGEADVGQILEVKSPRDGRSVKPNAEPLLQAVRAGLVAELKRLLSEGADVNVRSPFDDSSALHLAAIHGHSRIASTLLKFGADKGAVDDAGETPLMKAAELGHLAIVEKLLKVGADVNVLSCSCARGRAALHFAAGQGHSEVVQALLNRGADKDAQDDRGYTPLIWAIIGGSLPVVKTLLKAGVDTTIGSTEASRGLSARHVAARIGRNDMASSLLQAGARKDALNNIGETPLMAAFHLGHLAVLKTLVDAGANVDTLTTDGDFTPLHYAILANNPEIVSTLLEWGADTLGTDRQDLTLTPLVFAASLGQAREVEMMMAKRTALGQSSTDGCLALYASVEYEHAAVVSALLHGANKDALDCDGESPLSWALDRGHVELAAALLKRGDSINVRRRHDGATALHVVAGRGHDDIVSTLLLHGANKDVLDNNGTTPLHWATAEGHLAVVETLLAAGVNINIRSREEGVSALHVAAGRGHEWIVSALLRSGADVDEVDPNGDTALNWAAGLGYIRVVEVLLAAGANVRIRNSVEGHSALDWATERGHVGVQKAIRGRLAEVSASGDNGSTDMHLDSHNKVDHTQALIKGESNFGRRVQTETVRSGILSKSGGRGFHDMLAVPGWLDVEGVCLAAALFLWFSCRCKLRS